MPTSITPIPKTITAASEATADTLAQVLAIDSPEGHVAQRAVNMTGITATGILTPGNSAQVHIGILKAGDSTWEAELAAPIINGGDVFGWAGAIRLNEGDAVQAWASVASRIAVTVETESSE